MHAAPILGDPAMTPFLKTMVSAAGDRRAVYTRRPDGVIQVAFERWDDTAVGGTGGYNDPFWRPDGEGLLVNTIEEADRMAHERLGIASVEG
jgi:hypothetical protein